MCATAKAAGSRDSDCWKRLVEDWSVGGISNLYPISCYREALRHLPEDVRLYSSASDDIGRALARRAIASSPRSVSVVARRVTTSLKAVPEEKRADATLLLAGTLTAIVVGVGLAAFLARGVSRRSSRPAH